MLRPTTPSPSSQHAAGRAAAPRLRTRASPGVPLPTVREVLHTGRRLVIADLGSTNLLERPEAEALRQRGDAAILAVPLAVDGRNTAVLELVESRAPRAFTGANVTFAEFMARQAASLLSDDETTDAQEQPGSALPDGALAGEPRPAPRPQDLLLVLAGRLRHELRAVACDILRYDGEAGTLEPVAASASGEAPPLRGLSHPVADFGPAADALASGDPVLIRDLTAIQAAGPHLVRREQSGAKSVYASPIHLGQEVVGLIEVYSRDAAWSPDREELALIEAAAGTAALALAGDHDPAVLTRRVAQLDDLIAGFSDALADDGCGVARPVHPSRASHTEGLRRLHRVPGRRRRRDAVPGGRRRRKPRERRRRVAAQRLSTGSRGRGRARTRGRLCRRRRAADAATTSPAS